MRGRSKYGAVRTIVDGITFHSKAEARRYAELKLLERAGAIRELGTQPVFPIVVAGVLVGKYIADFTYLQGHAASSEVVVEDVKSEPTKTPLYRLKKKLVEALYPGVLIKEIG